MFCAVFTGHFSRLETHFQLLQSGVFGRFVRFHLLKMAKMTINGQNSAYLNAHANGTVSWVRSSVLSSITLLLWKFCFQTRKKSRGCAVDFIPSFAIGPRNHHPTNRHNEAIISSSFFFICVMLPVDFGWQGKKSTVIAEIFACFLSTRNLAASENHAHRKCMWHHRFL